MNRGVQMRRWAKRPTAWALAGGLLLALFFGVARSGLAASAASEYVAGTIRGTVTDASSGHPVADECVDAEGPSGYASTETLGDGTYSLGVMGGSYAIRFYDCGSTVLHVPVVYNGHPGVSFDPADAVAITVNGQTKSNVNASLPRAGSLKVHVQNGNGKPLPEAWICPDYATLNQQDTWCWSTNAYGNVTIADVPAGPSRLWASYDGPIAPGESYSGGLFYPKTPTFWLAQKINVTAGANAGTFTFVFKGAPDPASTVNATQPQPIWALVNGRPTQFIP